jgi:hypothetical protein
VTLAAVACGYAISVVRGIKVEEQNLRARHIEATKTIRQVYAAFKHDGHWPTKADATGNSKYALPPEWVYEDDPEGTGATLLLGGEFHMSVYYRFEPPQGNSPNKTWTISNEGDKSKFQTSDSYSPSPAP